MALVDVTEAAFQAETIELARMLGWCCAHFRAAQTNHGCAPAHVQHAADCDHCLWDCGCPEVCANCCQHPHCALRPEATP